MSQLAPRSRLILILLTLGFAGVTLRAQIKVLRIDPHLTDPSIETVRGPHLAVYDPSAAPNHRLFLFLSGTNAAAERSLPIDTAFAGWGFHAISLDYENNVLAAACGRSTDDTTCGHYREAIVTGAPVSDMIKVDPANSILNRFQALLDYLVRTDPAGGWSEFLFAGKPDWSRIVVAGHSQGSGHAAYIGKLFKVDRVLIFSGPQDYIVALDKPAPWQARPGATPPSRFFAFLNQQDPFNVHHQIANCMLLMDISTPDAITVEPGAAIQGHHQILINDIPTKNHHGSTLFPQFANVWQYMATTPIP